MAQRPPIDYRQFFPIPDPSMDPTMDPSGGMGLPPQPTPQMGPMGGNPMAPAQAQQSKLRSFLAAMGSPGMQSMEALPPPQVSGAKTSGIAEVFNALAHGTQAYGRAQESTMASQEKNQQRGLRNAMMQSPSIQKFLKLQASGGDFSSLTPMDMTMVQTLMGISPQMSGADQMSGARVKSGLDASADTKVAQEGETTRNAAKILGEANIAEKAATARTQEHVERMLAMTKGLNIEQGQLAAMAKESTRQEQTIAQNWVKMFNPKDPSESASVLAWSTLRAQGKDVPPELDAKVAQVEGYQKASLDMMENKGAARESDFFNILKTALMKKTGTHSWEDAMDAAPPAITSIALQWSSPGVAARIAADPAAYRKQQEALNGYLGNDTVDWWGITGNEYDYKETAKTQSMRRDAAMTKAQAEYDKISKAVAANGNRFADEAQKQRFLALQSELGQALPSPEN